MNAAQQALARGSAGYPVSMTVYLSPLEIMALLDKRGRRSSIRKAVTPKQILESPAVLVERTGSGFSASYNEDLASMIAAGIKKLDGAVSPDTMFGGMLTQLRREREWVQQTQEDIVEYICSEQKTYLASYNPFDLKPLKQSDVAAHIGYHYSLASRLLRNLAIQLPDGKAIFASELVPGQSTIGIKVRHALSLIAQDTSYFKDGKWQAPDDELLPYALELSDCSIKRRALSNYTRKFERAYAAATKAG